MAQGTKHELLQSAGALVRTSERELVAAALTAAGIAFSPVGVDGLLAHAEAEPLGKIVFATGIPVIELRPSDSVGLEEMFLELTAETQRETTNHRQPAGAPS
ncbi:MAG: hypothetical protein LH477_01965 [Nocardioides sp.]|nr:hypothetical protein [Nocardioides sp.]